MLKKGQHPKNFLSGLSMITVIPDFYAKPSTHHMHDLGSIDSHIQAKVFTDN
jgi:hypothetical protein